MKIQAAILSVILAFSSAFAGEKFFISNVFSGDKFELSCYGVETVCLADGTVADSPFIGYIPVRLAGVDSPEACPGEEARAEAREFGVSMRELFVYGGLEMLGAQIGKRLQPEVDVVFDSLTPDEFGFYHVYLPPPGIFAKRYKSRNEWIIAEGRARVPRDEEFFFKEEFLALEKQARERRLDYWDGLFDLPLDAEGNRIIRGYPHGIQ